jgi:UV DNA damage endonuclease
MRVGYPCINRSIGCRGNRTFRLANYSEERLKETVRNNLGCLMQMLRWNVEHSLLFFRITSDLIPFASHPVNRFPWQEFFSSEFQTLGRFIRDHKMRISMHPDQFVLISAPDEGVRERSMRELAYHAAVLDLLGLDAQAKLQIHIGGVYGDRERSIRRFIDRFHALDESLRARLAIENDSNRYSAADCLKVSRETGIPVIFDVFHHRILNQGEAVRDILGPIRDTWEEGDGIPMVDYSTQRQGAWVGAHTESIDRIDFMQFLSDSRQHDIDIMLEIKDKEKSALQAVEIAREDPRFVEPSGDTGRDPVSL